MAQLRDRWGRRVWKSEAAAFRAQRTAHLEHGVMSGVVRRSDGRFVLLLDIQAEA